MEKVVIGNAELWHGDCLEVLPLIGAVDACITDPPFEAEAHTLQRRINRSKTRGEAGDVVSEEPLGFNALKEEERDGLALWCASNVGGWLLAFCQVEAIYLWRKAMQESGVTYKRGMVWIKPDGMPQYSGDRPGMGYESIAAGWCGQGKSVWNGGGRHGVFTYGKNSGGKHEHPTQKPLPLMNQLVSLFTDKGQTILDPFMGSASTGCACMNLERKFIGIELDERHFQTACERIDRAQQQGKLF